MYAMVRQYVGVHMDANELDDALRQTALSLSDTPGFVSFLAVEAGADLLVTLTVFETQEALVEATASAETWPASPSQEPLPVPEVMTGEIVFQRGL